MAESSFATINKLLVDLSDDDDLWQPPLLLETDKLYPETKCHSTLTFVHFCYLAEASYLLSLHLVWY